MGNEIKVKFKWEVVGGIGDITISSVTSSVTFTAKIGGVGELLATAEEYGQLTAPTTHMNQTITGYARVYVVSAVHGDYYVMLYLRPITQH